jgi:hypothetical protein
MFIEHLKYLRRVFSARLPRIQLMTDYRIVIPILNHKVVGLVDPAWQLSPDIGVETVLDEDHAAILRDPRKGDSDQISISAKVINGRMGTTKPTHENALKLAAVAQFCLNYFAEEPGACISWACVLAPGKKKQMLVVEYFDLSAAPIAPVARHRKFKIEKKTARASLTGMYEASTKALERFPGAIMTIDRFCRALSRDDKHDRLVDLCICLESLIDGNNELRFRFSQLHSMLAEPDATKRLAAFELFQDFYDARSKVVHGDPAASKKVANVEKNWPELLRYARLSLAYYFAYLSDKDRATWNDHVRKIFLGIESPTTWS